MDSLLCSRLLHHLSPLGVNSSHTVDKAQARTLARPWAGKEAVRKWHLVAQRDLGRLLERVDAGRLAGEDGVGLFGLLDQKKRTIIKG